MVPTRSNMAQLVGAGVRHLYQGNCFTLVPHLYPGIAMAIRMTKLLDPSKCPVARTQVGIDFGVNGPIRAPAGKDDRSVCELIDVKWISGVVYHCAECLIAP